LPNARYDLEPGAICRSYWAVCGRPARVRETWHFDDYFSRIEVFRREKFILSDALQLITRLDRWRHAWVALH